MISFLRLSRDFLTVGEDPYLFDGVVKEESPPFSETGACLRVRERSDVGFDCGLDLEVIPAFT